MNWQLVLEFGIPIVCVVLVLVPKLTRSIFLESLLHPLRRSEIQVDGRHVSAAHR